MIRNGFNRFLLNNDSIQLEGSLDCFIWPSFCLLKKYLSDSLKGPLITRSLLFLANYFVDTANGMTDSKSDNVECLLNRMSSHSRYTEWAKSKLCARSKIRLSWMYLT